MSQLTHPNTVAVYDYGRTPDGVFYYAMEYLDGIDLEQLVAAHGPQPRRARDPRSSSQVCGALHEAHERGLDPPRHQAGEHHPVRARRRARRREGGRLRPGQGDQRATPGSRRRSILGTPHYLAPGGGHRARDASGRRRSLRARRGRLLPAHRQARVRGQDRRRRSCIQHVTKTPRAPERGRHACDVPSALEERDHAVPREEHRARASPRRSRARRDARGAAARRTTGRAQTREAVVGEFHAQRKVGTHRATTMTDDRSRRHRASPSAATDAREEHVIAVRAARHPSRITSARAVTAERSTSCWLAAAVLVAGRARRRRDAVLSSSWIVAVIVGGSRCRGRDRRVGAVARQADARRGRPMRATRDAAS